MRALFSRCIPIVLLALATFEVGPQNVLLAAQQNANPALLAALRKYGWAIPVCTAPSDSPRSAYCVTVGELIEKHPFHSGQIIEAILLAATGALERVPLDSRTRVPAPEAIIDRLVSAQIVLGCARPSMTEKGSSRLAAVVTLGVMGNLSGLESSQDLCGEAPQSAGGEFASVLDLIARASATGSIALTADDSAYKAYLAECQQRRRAMRQAPIEGQSSSEDEKKKEEEARKKMEEAAKANADAQKKADEAAKKAEEARQAAEAADQQAQDIQNDPNATEEEKAAAARASETAWNEYRAAKASADQHQRAAQDAQADFDEAQSEHRRAQNDLDYAQDVEQLANELGPHLYSPYFEQPSLTGGFVGAWMKFAGGFVATWWGHYGPGAEGDCFYSECSQSCEQEARVRALRDSVVSRLQTEQCDPRARPAPGGSDCFNVSAPIVSEAEAAALLRAICTRRQQVDLSCFNETPARDFTVAIDPCSGPLVMCKPDAKRNKDNLSAPIPNNAGVLYTDAWIKLPSVPGVRP